MIYMRNDYDWLLDIILSDNGLAFVLARCGVFKIDRSLDVVRDCTSVNTPDIAVSLCFVLYHVIQKYLGGHFYPHLIQKALYLIVQSTGR